MSNRKMSDRKPLVLVLQGNKVLSDAQPKQPYRKPMIANKFNRYTFMPYRVWIGLVVLLVGLMSVAALLPETLPLQRKIAAFFAALAMVAMALTFLLATRSQILERLFGGLDKMYYVHRISGVVAVAGIFLHWMLVPQLPGGMQDDFSVAEIGSDAGEWATWLLLALMAISFAGFIPYRFWKWTHKLMGLVFVISVVHFLFAEKPFGLFSPAGVVMIMASIIGIWAWVYYSFGFDRSKKSLAKVRNIRHWDDGVEFEVRPITRDVSWEPGQFAFVSFIRNDHISSESHPFTIASAPGDGSQWHSNSPRFSVSASGDYTRNLKQQIRDRDLVLLEMPYGHFTLPGYDHPQVWIGAGIGITPFLAWLQMPPAPNPQHPVYLYYCVKDESAAIYDKEIREQIEKQPHIRYALICSSARRLDGERIQTDLGQPLDNVSVFFCGGTTMRESLQSKLAERGLNSKRFHYEMFDFRSAL